jgi:F-box-like
MQEPSRRRSRDSIARALPQPDDYVYEGWDGDSRSSREDFTLDRALTDMHPNIPQLGAHALSRRVDSHQSEDTPLSFLEHAPAQTLIEEQCLTSLQRPPSTMSDGDIFAPQQTPSTDEQMPAVNMRGCSAQRERTGLDQPDSAKLLRKPPVCQPKGTSCGWPVIPTEIYLEIARYLSREDALNLRLVCRDFSIAMMGAIFGSVVVPFGRAMYDTNLTNTDHTPSGSIFEKYGLAIRKFGICFEADAGMVPSDIGSCCSTN